MEHFLNSKRTGHFRRYMFARLKNEYSIANNRLVEQSLGMFCIGKPVTTSYGYQKCFLITHYLM